MPSVAIASVETVTVNGMVMGPRSAIAFSSSPTTIQNTTANRLMVVLASGTVTTIEFSRDGVTFDAVGLLGGQFILNPGDSLRVTYVVAPTGSCYPVCHTERVAGVQYELPTEQTDRKSTRLNSS